MLARRLPANHRFQFA